MKKQRLISYICCLVFINAVHAQYIYQETKCSFSNVVYKDRVPSNTIRWTLLRENDLSNIYVNGVTFNIGGEDRYMAAVPKYGLKTGNRVDQYSLSSLTFTLPAAFVVPHKDPKSDHTILMSSVGGAVLKYQGTTLPITHMMDGSKIFVSNWTLQYRVGALNPLQQCKHMTCTTVENPAPAVVLPSAPSERDVVIPVQEERLPTYDEATLPSYAEACAEGS